MYSGTVASCQYGRTIRGHYPYVAAHQPNWTPRGDGRRCEAYASQLSPKTWMHYRQLLNKHILPSLGPLELREIRPETIGRWQAERLGADGIDDCEVLRAGRTRRLLGGSMPAPSTLGTFYARSRSGTCVSSMLCSGVVVRWPGARRGTDAVEARPSRCCTLA